ncbi:hypothetical protein [Methanobrevibacter sp.]|uniref:hypothetical protein n=1 Tax=Methanobrevibacter sp. TaxID=66852 RepID=UPI0025F9F348|nr:hypothetical protein [Methanobrevibacter sp.]MBQ2961754.1 hypothetical protein [Methanobrevibacter sp.]
MSSNHDKNSQSEYNFNLSHDDGDVVDESYDIDYENDSNIELDDNSNENYQGVDDSPYSIAKNDPDWYYDHYDYGDYDDIDEYLESQGY